MYIKVILGIYESTILVYHIWMDLTSNQLNIQSTIISIE